MYFASPKYAEEEKLIEEQRQREKVLEMVRQMEKQREREEKARAEMQRVEKELEAERRRAMAQQEQQQKLEAKMKEAAEVKRQQMEQMKQSLMKQQLAELQQREQMQQSLMKQQLAELQQERKRQAEVVRLLERDVQKQRRAHKGVISLQDFDLTNSDVLDKDKLDTWRKIKTFEGCLETTKQRIKPYQLTIPALERKQQELKKQKEQLEHAENGSKDQSKSPDTKVDEEKQIHEQQLKDIQNQIVFDSKQLTDLESLAKWEQSQLKEAEERFRKLGTQDDLKKFEAYVASLPLEKIQKVREKMAGGCGILPNESPDLFHLAQDLGPNDAYKYLEETVSQIDLETESTLVPNPQPKDTMDQDHQNAQSLVSLASMLDTNERIYLSSRHLLEQMDQCKFEDIFDATPQVKEEWEDIKRKLPLRDHLRAAKAFKEKICSCFRQNLGKATILESLNLSPKDIPAHVMNQLSCSVKYFEKEAYSQNKKNDAAFLKEDYLVPYDLVNLAANKLKVSIAETSQDDESILRDGEMETDDGDALDESNVLVGFILTLLISFY